jgi:hypothetical protein
VSIDFINELDSILVIEGGLAVVIVGRTFCVWILRKGKLHDIEDLVGVGVSVLVRQVNRPLVRFITSGDISGGGVSVSTSIYRKVRVLKSR